MNAVEIEEAVTLLARKAHWPATKAEFYDPEHLREGLHAAHDRNDETLERIYIGRRFKNDTERLETLFRLYAEMTSAPHPRPLSPKRGEGSQKSREP